MKISVLTIWHKVGRGTGEPIAVSLGTGAWTLTLEFYLYLYLHMYFIFIFILIFIFGNRGIDIDNKVLFVIINNKNHLCSI